MNPDHTQYLVSNYAQPTLEITKGQGSYLFDVNGTKFLDFTSGIAVTNIGHSREHWVASKQTDKRNNSLLQFVLDPRTG